jgi:transposase
LTLARKVSDEFTVPLCRCHHRDLHRYGDDAACCVQASVARPIDYMLKRWNDFARFLNDGRICLTNNAAERALRGFAVSESLCIPSSNIDKHWKRVVVGDATRATFSGYRRFDRFRRQVVGANLVRRAGHNLHRGQHTGFDQTAYRVACDV